MSEETTVPAECRPVEKSYFEMRMEALGVTEELNKIMVLPSDDEYLKRETLIFQQDAYGNIDILYPTLDGCVYTYDNGTKNHPIKWFYRTRLKEPRVHPDGSTQKYDQPKGSGVQPFFNPGLIEKYRLKEKIPILYFIEGEFKAFAGYIHGLDIVGLPSYTGFYSNDHKKQLHYDLAALIVQCQVEKVVLLTDADTITINWAEGKDLYQRPRAFYDAVKTWREACDLLIRDKDNALKDVFYGHIKTELVDQAEGLDDLLTTFPEQANYILADLNQLSYANKYFQIFNISDNILTNLLKHFGIANENDFYQVYGKFIGSKEFTYRRRRYQFDGSDVVYIRHEEADEYMRIGDQYMRVVPIPNKHGEQEEMLRKWKVGEIVRDYRKYGDFIDQIRKYKAFCNMPDNSTAYRREHEGCYNIYHPLKFNLQEGGIEASIKFMKHLFGGQGWVNSKGMECVMLGDPFTVALDYMTLLYQQPTQILPVPCLVSPENNTGKSTFLKWLKDMYGANATILGNEQFKMSFNSHYITKYIIGIDEGFIEVDKKADKERLKKLATDDRQFLEFKGMDVQEIDFFGKIIICSNDADRLMKIEEGEIRWFVVKVPQFTEEDPDFRKKLKSEIPAFLHYLKNRKVFHPHEGRAWFNPKYLVTDQLKRIISTTRNRLEKVVDEFAKNLFLTFRQPVIRIHLEYFAEQVNKISKFKIDSEDLKAYLKDKKALKPQPTQRYRFPSHFDEDAFGKISIQYLKFHQKPFVLQVNEWLSKEEMEEFESDFDPNYDAEEADERNNDINEAPKGTQQEVVQVPF
jgi:hypothetical protein